MLPQRILDAEEHRFNSMMLPATAGKHPLAPISFDEVCYNRGMEVMGFVTAGGRSSRMGLDKAWLELGGRAMISHVLDALRPVVTDIAVIANRDDYAVLGVPIVSDSNRGIGPIEAVRASLAASRFDRVIVVGCDLPFVTPELFRYLLSQAGRYQSVVPLDRDNIPEPLCAIYSRSSLPEVERMIKAGQFKISPLFKRIETLLVGFEELSGLRGSDLFFENINTPEEYRRALALKASGHDSRQDGPSEA
jgi:molybdenum cofactor guanylyltransferase